jgi:hypothetical protein
MTAQISDSVLYRKKPRTIAGINGSGLFDPAEHGIRPVMISTACWRGYYCTYEVADESLFLIEVHLGLDERDATAAARGEGTKLFGIVPRRYTEHGYCQDVLTGQVTTSWESSDYKVDGIREPIPFTGGLLLGDRFIQTIYVHMGFHPAYKFRDVHELVFDAGRLIGEHDRSAQMAEFREMLSPESLKPGSGASPAEVQRWIQRCFSREYKGFAD